jgi:O-antigen/teichoic acid export membrane protein
MRGAMLRLAGYGAGAALATVSAILLTRYLGVVRFGQYTTVIAVVTLASQLTDAGLTNLATREYAVLSGDVRSRLMSRLLGLRIAITVPAIMGATAFAVIAGYNGTRIAGTALAGLGLGLASIQGVLAVPLIVGLRLGWVAALELFRQTLLVTLTIVLILVGAGLLPLLSALVPSSLAVVLATIVMVRGRIPLRPSMHPMGWVALLRPTFVFSLATGLGAVYLFTAQILTSLATTAYQTGLFSASFRVFAVVAASSGLLISSAFPLLARAARDDHERLGFAMQRLFEVATILGVAAALTAVTGAGPIIAVIAGPRYAAAAPVLRIEGAALLGSFLLSTWSYALISLREHRALLMSNVTALTVTAVMTLVLASAHGAQGGAVGSVAGEWVLAVGYLLALTRGKAYMRPQAGPTVKVLLAAVPAFAVMLLHLPGFLQPILALTVYTCAILASGALPRELYELLPSRRRRGV